VIFLASHFFGTTSKGKKGTPDKEENTKGKGPLSLILPAQQHTTLSISASLSLKQRAVHH
jgi:hypothetical protein